MCPCSCHPHDPKRTHPPLGCCACCPEDARTPALAQAFANQKIVGEEETELILMDCIDPGAHPPHRWRTSWGPRKDERFLCSGRRPSLSWDDPASDPLGDVRRALRDAEVHAHCDTRIRGLQIDLSGRDNIIANQRRTIEDLQRQIREGVGRQGWGQRG